MASDNSHSIGHIGFAFYGKLPGAGDFVSRRMPYPLQTFWDRWCASGVEMLKDRNRAPGWGLWGNAPKWAFLLPMQPGLPIGQFGVLAPSCDRVGRNFPFLVTTAIVDDNAKDLLPRAASLALAWAQVIADAQSARMSADAADVALSSALSTELEKSPAPADGEVTLPPGTSPLTLPWPGLSDSFDRQHPDSFWWSVPQATTGFRARTHSGALAASHFVNLCG